MDAFPGRFISEIWDEAQRLPYGMMDAVLEAKAYMIAKRQFDTASDPAHLPTDWPMLDSAKQITFAETQRKIDEAARG